MFKQGSKEGIGGHENLCIWHIHIYLLFSLHKIHTHVYMYHNIFNEKKEVTSIKKWGCNKIEISSNEMLDIPSLFFCAHFWALSALNFSADLYFPLLICLFLFGIVSV